MILADEPTGSLDRANADTIGNLLLELSRDAGAALICVTHSSELATRFPRRAELRDGTLVESHYPNPKRQRGRMLLQTRNETVFIVARSARPR